VPEPLRPLSFGQLIDVAGRLIWSAPQTLVGLAALPFAFFLPATALPLPSLDQVEKLPDFAPLLPWLPHIIVGGLIYVSVLSLVMTVVLAGQAYAAAVARTDRAPHFGVAWRVGWKNVWPLSSALLLLVLVPIVSMLPVFALIMLLRSLSSSTMIITAIGLIVVWALAMFYAIARLSLIVPVVTLERRTGAAALRRSWDLMHGQVTRVVGMFLVVGVSVTIVSALIGAAVGAAAIVQPSVGVWLGALVQLCLQAVGSAINGALLVVVYLDLRCRREGFDLAGLSDLLETVERTAR